MYFEETINKPICPDAFYLEIDLRGNEAVEALRKIGFSRLESPTLQWSDTDNLKTGATYWVMEKKVFEDEISKRPGENSYSNRLFPSLPLSEITLNFDKREAEDIAEMKLSTGTFSLSQLPEERRTKAVCEAAVNAFPSNIEYVPEQFVTKELMLSAIKQDGEILSGLDEKRITDEMYLLAVKTDPSIYKDMPERLKTEEVHQVLVEQDAMLLGRLDKKDRTRSVCNAALQSFIRLEKGDSCQLISLLPIPEICHDFIAKNGPIVGAYELLKYVDKEVLNTDIAKEAISQDIRCVALLSPSIQDKEVPVITQEERGRIIVMTEFPNDTNAYRKIPDERKTPILSYAAVCTNPTNLQFVPDDQRADINLLIHALKGASLMENENKEEIVALFMPELSIQQKCEMIVDRDVSALAFLPKTIIAQNLDLQNILDKESLLLNPSYTTFENLPEERKTENCSFAAVQTDYTSFYNVPEASMSGRVIFAALERGGETISHVPLERRTEEMYLTALNNGQGINGVLNLLPPEMLTPAICQRAVEVSAYNLEFVPEELKTREMCRTALYSSPDLGYGDAYVLQDIPFSDVLLEGLKLYATGLETSELLTGLPTKAIDSRVAEWFVHEDPSLFSFLPKNVQTEDLAFIAAQKSGSMAFLADYDKSVITPRVTNEARMTDLSWSFNCNNMPGAEKCLEIEKHYPEFFHKYPDLLSKEIIEGCNPYSLNKRIELVAAPEKFTTQQINDLFDGKTLNVSKIVIGKKTLHDQCVSFDKCTRNISISPQHQATEQQVDEKKQQVNERKEKKRGPKL